MVKEVSIEVELDQSRNLVGWRAFLSGNSLVFRGTVTRTSGVSEEVSSKSTVFFDSERGIFMDTRGEFWRVLAENAESTELVDRTLEVIGILKRPRSERAQEELTPSEELLLQNCILDSKTRFTRTS